MTGVELAQEILRLRPDIPIILCTGFVEGIDTISTKALGIREIVRKPIISRALAQTMRRFLDLEEVAAAIDGPETG